MTGYDGVSVIGLSTFETRGSKKNRRSTRSSTALSNATKARRYEFYESYDLPYQIDELRPFVDAFGHRFNPVRPHDALDGQAPPSISTHSADETSASV